MPDLRISLSEYATKDPEFKALQDDIAEARREYAEWDKNNNPHEYLGLVEHLYYARRELQRIYDEQKKLFPEATFILEYHQSCMLPKEAGFLVVSFALQTKRVINGSQSRLNSYISLKLEKKSDYTIENSAIEQFMEKNGIAAYDDGFGGRSIIQYEEY